MIMLAVAFSLLLMSCLAIPPVAAQADDYQVTFDGTEYLIPQEKGTVTVHVATDRPSGNYSWNASLDSGDVTPKKGSGDAESFNVTVTAPDITGDIVLSVTLTNGTVNHTARYTLHVIDPTVISATVKNSGLLGMEDVKVRFLADGVVVNTTTFSIPANSTKTVSYNWTAHGLSNGEHTVQVVLDPDNEYVRFLDGPPPTPPNSMWGIRPGT
jgi:hypothetical protein